MLPCAASTTIFRVNIDDEIGSTTWHNVRQAIVEANNIGSPMLLVHINTYGGSVMHADSIRTALLHYPAPVVAWIDNNAASAGALIALACDSVFMRTDATMGAATVVNGNDGTAMPDKYQSYMRAMMRATAESHGRDSLGRWRRNPTIAEAMVDTRIAVPGLIDSTKVLTFTTSEAMKWGYADGVAENQEQLLQALNVTDANVKTYKPDWVNTLLGFLTNPALQAMLIMIIIGGIYFELHTPGVGFPLMASIAAAVIYFLPMVLVGIVSPWIVILFTVGIMLLLAEIFIIPGFGIVGIAGIAAMLVALFAGLIESIPAHLPSISASSIWLHAAAIFAGAVIAASLIMWFITSRFMPKKLQRATQLTHAQHIEDGYIGVDTSLNTLVGSKAITETDMRPSGKIGIDGKICDAVSEQGFLAVGTSVIITRYENAQLYVKAISVYPNL